MTTQLGFSFTQLEQLKALLAEERQQTKALLAEERQHNDRQREKQTALLKQYTQQETAKLKRSLIRLIGKTKNELQQSIATLATHSPTRKEFEKLKVKVDYYHPDSSLI